MKCNVMAEIKRQFLMYLVKKKEKKNATSLPPRAKIFQKRAKKSQKEPKRVF